MKIVLNIFITLLLFISMLCGLLFTFTNTDNVETMRTNSLGMGILSAFESFTGDVPTAEDFQRAVYVDALFAFLCLGGIVFTYIRKKNVGLIVAGLVGIFAVLFYALQPSFNKTIFQQENTDKDFAMAVMIMALIGAGLMVLLKLKFTSTSVKVAASPVDGGQQ